METQQLHRGRLIDHLQLVTPDLEASRRFYGAVLAALDVPIGGEAERFFWADELFVSAVDSIAAAGRPTGRCHLAFQARDRAMVEAFHKAGLAAGGTDNGALASGPITPATTPPSCWTRTATTSRRSSTARPSARPTAWW